MDWSSRPANIVYLIDSGLLFEANRQIFHLFGLALVARKDEQGRVWLDVKDSRAEPEKFIFNKDVRDACRLKYKQFMKSYGNKVMDQRVAKLGFATQWVPSEIGA